jgi:hypothetical protein
MPKISIAEFPGNVPSGAVAALKLPPLAEQIVSVGGTTMSQPFSNGSTLIRVLTDAACAIQVGDAGPGLDALRLAPGVPEIFTVEPGGKLTIMAIEPETPPATTQAAAPRHQNMPARKKPVHRRRSR